MKKAVSPNTFLVVVFREIIKLWIYDGQQRIFRHSVIQIVFV